MLDKPHERPDGGQSGIACARRVAALFLEMVEELERQHLVHRALDQLGEPCRELVKSLCLDPDDVSYEKLAARLGMPVGSIGPTRARCFKKLEAILVSLGIDERS